HVLTKQNRGEERRKHGVRTSDQRSQPRGDTLHADEIESEIKRVVRHPDHRECDEVRRASRHSTPGKAAAASITAPASSRRAATIRSGGQSARASFDTAKAELQSRQNIAATAGDGM